MSKWGIEEKETLDAINKMNLSGNILDVAAGDGRFINELLKYSDAVTAIDIDNNELQTLKDNCSSELIDKLKLEVLDITKAFPYQDNTFDGIFCTGTLHLFDKNTITLILKEMKRCLKFGGKIILDFATDIKRLDKNGNEVIFEGEGSYSTDEAIVLFKDLLSDFSFDIQIATFSEEDLEDAGYNSIHGNFLIITGEKI